MSAVLRLPIDEMEEWQHGFMAPTQFVTSSGRFRVFVVTGRTRFRIPYFTKKRRRIESPNEIETTDIEGFHCFLADSRVEELSSIFENDCGVDCFNFSVESGVTIKVRNSNINIPYIEAMHLGYC